MYMFSEFCTLYRTGSGILQVCFYWRFHSSFIDSNLLQTQIRCNFTKMYLPHIQVTPSLSTYGRVLFGDNFLNKVNHSPIKYRILPGNFLSFVFCAGHV